MLPSGKEYGIILSIPVKERCFSMWVYVSVGVRWLGKSMHVEVWKAGWGLSNADSNLPEIHIFHFFIVSLDIKWPQLKIALPTKSCRVRPIAPRAEKDL